MSVALNQLHNSMFNTPDITQQQKATTGSELCQYTCWGGTLPPRGLKSIQI